MNNIIYIYELGCAQIGMETKGFFYVLICLLATNMGISSFKGHFLE